MFNCLLDHDPPGRVGFHSFAKASCVVFIVTQNLLWNLCFDFVVYIMKLIFLTIIT